MVCVGGEVIGEFLHLRVVPPELMMHAVTQPNPFLPQFLGKARPRAQAATHPTAFRPSAPSPLLRWSDWVSLLVGEAELLGDLQTVPDDGDVVDAVVRRVG